MVATIDSGQRSQTRTRTPPDATVTLSIPNRHNSHTILPFRFDGDGAHVIPLALWNRNEVV
jgi:hypothetical protein